MVSPQCRESRAVGLTLGLNPLCFPEYVAALRELARLVEGGGNPGAQLNEIITEGASHGLHLLISVDTFGNVQRWLNRKAIAEFEFRVLFQMSANDSASLIDSPQASGLGLYRALLYNEKLS